MHGTRDCKALARHNTYTGFFPNIHFLVHSTKRPDQCVKSRVRYCLETPILSLPRDNHSFSEGTLLTMAFSRHASFGRGWVVSGTR
jgi:hypothetical protein